MQLNKLQVNTYNNEKSMYSSTWTQWLSMDKMANKLSNEKRAQILSVETGISKTLWEISDIDALIPEESPKKRGSYKKKI